MAWKKTWIQNNHIVTFLSLLLSPIALHPSRKGAGAIFNSVLLLCLLPHLPLPLLLFNYSPIKGGLPHPTQTQISAHSALVLLLCLCLTSLMQEPHSLHTPPASLPHNVFNKTHLIHLPGPAHPACHPSLPLLCSRTPAPATCSFDFYFGGNLCALKTPSIQLHNPPPNAPPLGKNKSREHHLILIHPFSAVFMFCPPPSGCNHPQILLLISQMWGNHCCPVLPGQCLSC